MSKGTVETQRQESGSTNPAVNAAVTQLANNLQTQVNTGYKPFTGSTYGGISGQTQSAARALGNNPNAGIFNTGISGTLGQQANIAQGNFGDDPTRNRIIDDVTRNVSATFQGSGRFGSMSNERALIDETAGALAQYDYGRQQQAIANLPALYGASAMPAEQALIGGQVLDANQQAARLAEAEQFERNNNTGWETLMRGSQALGVVAPSSGQYSSQSQPWWSAALGAGLATAGTISGFGRRY